MIYSVNVNDGDDEVEDLLLQANILDALGYNSDEEIEVTQMTIDFISK